MALYFKNTNEDIILTEQDEKHYRDNKIFRFSEREIISDKLTDHCHLTGKKRGPARNKCDIIFTQRQCKFVPFEFQNFSICHYHLFFKRLVNKTIGKIKKYCYS